MIVDLFVYKGCLGILEVYVCNKKLILEIFLEAIVRKIFGFLGVDLVNMLNEVVILIVRWCKEGIIFNEIDDVIDWVIIGLSFILLLDGKKKWLIVYYELGYVLLMILLKNFDFFNKVIIIFCFGGVGGFV